MGFKKALRQWGVGVFFAFTLSGCVFFTKDIAATRSSQNADSTCVNAGAQTYFTATVDPVLEMKCTTCHSSLAFRLTVGSPGSNYTNAKSEGQKIADYGTGGSGHPGGAVLAASDAALVANWLTLENTPCTTGTSGTLTGSVCSVNNRAPANTTTPLISSNLARSSGEALYLRLTSLFPNQAVTASDFDLFLSAGLNQSLANDQRFTSPTAQIAFLGKIESFCSTAVGAPQAAPSALLADFRLAGETIPTNAATRDVLMMARNIWVYPYAQNSPEVIELQTAYLGAYNASLAAGTSAAQSNLVGETTVCVAALQAPQFWLGNSGALDVLRKVALEVGKTIPTAQDFAGLQGAADRSAWMRAYVANLQTQPAYLQAVKYWHRDWLGLRTLNWTAGGNYDPRGWTLANGGASATMGHPAGLSILNAPGTTLNGAWRLTPNENRLGYIYINSQACQAIDQPFDPRTIEIRWEQMNPTLGNAYEVIGSLQKQGNAWVEVPGSITLANGTKRVTGIADVNFGQTNGAGYQYIRGNLVGTPLEFFAKGSRRVRRFSPSGEQNGFSHVKLPFSGQDAVVCNTLDRFIASCVYRVTAPGNTGVATTVYDESNRGNGNTAAWNGQGIANFLADKVTYGPRNPRPIFNSDSVYADSFAHGLLLDQMRCGNPDPVEAAKAGLPGYNENLAYPVGYLSLTDPNPPAVAGLISTAINPNYQLALSAASPEAQAIAQVKSDLGQDASRLITHVIGSGLDYRQILLANYTFGSDYTRYYLATQSFFLPFPLPGFTPSATPGSVVQYSSAGFGPYNSRWLRNDINGSSMPNSWQNYFANPNLSNGSDVVPPKPIQGILNTVEFMGPVSTGMRTVASRIITRATCSAINTFVPDATQAILQTAFVTQKTHLQPTCLKCHINLDPLAAAMNANFAADPMMVNPAIKKYTAEMDNSQMNGLYGIRGLVNPGPGAFLGQPITGLAGLANVLANSDQFATCAVRKAFENIFGRALPTVETCVANPINPDCALVYQTTQIFKLDYNYNKMVQELVASPLNLTGN